MDRNILDVDVRAILLAKGEPFQVIMDAVGTLGTFDVLQLHTTFDPAPLKRVLSKQGFHCATNQEADDHYILQFYHSDESAQNMPPVWHLDNRGLEPPEPMVRTLSWLDDDPRLGAGELALEIWNERVPAFLLPELEDREFNFDVNDLENGTVIVRIYREAS